MDIRRFADAETLAAGAAARIVDLIGTAVASRGRCSIALAGGGTPKRSYEVLATPEWAKRVDWERLHVFWGDERCVGPDHPESNFLMARETLLGNVPIPPANVHRIKGELAPAVAAKQYENLLRTFMNESTPTSRSRDDSLDIVLLGIGTDGHTASLFPGSEAVENAIRGTTDRWAVENYVPKLETWRVTLTTIPINLARNVLFLVSGADKAPTLQRVLAGPHTRDILPVDLIEPRPGQLSWLVDEDAARRLPDV